MKKFKNRLIKLLAIALSALMLFGATACKKEPVEIGDGGSKDIKVKIVVAGYDTDWLHAIANKFNEVYASEGYKVTITLEDTVLNAANEVKTPKRCDTDIFFEYDNIQDLIPQSYSILRQKGVAVLEDLTDVWNSPAIGVDKKPVGDKLIDRIAPSGEISGYKYNGTMSGYDGIYGIPYQGGNNGIYYNPSVLEQFGYDANDLLTTDDFLAVIDDIAPEPTRENVSNPNLIFPVAWSFTKTGGYHEYALKDWIAQYEGAESFKNFLQFIPDEGTIIENGYKVYEKKGIYEAVKVLYQYLNRDYSNPRISEYDHVQAEALVATGKSAFMVTGDYMYKELEKNYSEYMGNVLALRTPVISALGIKLNLCGAASHEEDASCANCNEKLRNIVLAVDENTLTDDQIATAQGVTAEKVATIREARGYYVGGADGSSVQAFIPSYADAKIGAKLFLRFMFNNECMKLYRDATYVDMPATWITKPADDDREFVQSMADKRLAPNAMKLPSTYYTSKLRQNTPIFPREVTVPAVYQSLSHSHTFGRPSLTPKQLFEGNIEWVKISWPDYLQAANLT